MIGFQNGSHTRGLSHAQARFSSERSKRTGQRPTAALGFDLQQTGNLHGRSQEDRMEHLLPSMPGRLATFRERVHELGKVEHLVEVNLESVPRHAY